MATYVIGDIQGCFDELKALLAVINYQEDTDELWFTGDLVNRGPKSLEVLRFIKAIPRCVTVLGNHDLGLLTLAHTPHHLKNHTLDEILLAPDCAQLLTWLRQQPLLYAPANSSYVLVHAGIPPQWSLSEAKRLALEVEIILKGPDYLNLLETMFGNVPALWNEDLQGADRYRYIINAFTRMRFCDGEGRLELGYKGTITEAPADLLPWFTIADRKTRNDKILFGHWAALEGQVTEPNVYALDTGCVWGGSLTALRLEDGQRFSVKCGE